LQQEGFDIYAFDAPGHGGSGGNYLHVPLYAKVIRQLRDKLGTEYQIGHSMGGMAILYDLHEQPSDDVSKIITLGAPTHFAYILDQYEKALGLRSHVRVSLEARVLEMVGRSVYDFNTIEFSRGLKVPGLLLHDLEDPAIPYTDAVELEQHWDSSRLVLTRGYGHSLHHRDVHHCVTDFLCDRPLRIESAEPTGFTNTN
jgi:pimeloyl-ACP methyl ester carboxylesterase